MAEERKERRERLTREEEDVLQQQYLRALSSFEGIILSQIDIKNKLGARLNYSIQTGIILLGGIAISMLILLLTLSAQVNRMSDVVNDMNSHFSNVAQQMHRMRGHMSSMEQRVALMEGIEARTGIMEREIGAISGQMGQMRQNVRGINSHLAAVRNDVGNISVNMDIMNNEVQAMSQEVHRVAKPARTMNKMFPFP
jgi:uncharacterized protein YoxC